MLVRARTKTYDFNIHLVWVTKYRRAIFNTPEKVDVLKAIIQKIAEDNALTIASFEVMPEHVHLLISFDPQRSVASVVKALKGSSAKRWFEQFPETRQQLWKGHLWSPSYYVGTVGNVSKNIVESYIENQTKK